MCQRYNEQTYGKKRRDDSGYEENLPDVHHFVEEDYHRLARRPANVPSGRPAGMALRAITNLRAIRQKLSDIIKRS